MAPSKSTTIGMKQQLLNSSSEFLGGMDTIAAQKTMMSNTLINGFIQRHIVGGQNELRDYV